MDGNCHILADSRWEMLLKAAGQPLSTSERVLESRWEMPKSYWKTSGQFLKGIGKPLGNAQRLLENLCAILKGYRKAAGKCPKYPLSANRRGGRIVQRLLEKTWQFPSLFSEGQCFCLHY
jgi:hypothetical protein